MTIGPVPVYNGDILYLTFPSTIVVPSTAVCVNSIGFTSISCVSSGQNLIVTMTTLTTNKFTGSLKFTLKGVKNAPSTARQPGFTNVYFTDASGLSVQQLISNAAASIDQTTKAANLLKYSLYQDNLQMGAMATYKIEFTPTNSIGSAGSIVITWPPQVSINSTAGCQVTTNTKQSNLCTIDPTRSTITIQGAFTPFTSGYTGSVIIELFPV